MKLRIKFKDGSEIICCQFYLSQELVVLQTRDGEAICELPVAEFNARLAKWFENGVKVEVAAPGTLHWNCGREIVA